MSHDVPPGETPAVCSRCGERFPSAEILALHREQAHGPALTHEERAAARSAAEAEREALRLYRLKALGGVVLLYFGFLMVYAVVT